MSSHYNHELRTAYRDNNPFDEVVFFLGMKMCGQEQWVGLVEDGTDINHIWSNPRRDLQSNLICLTRANHTKFHHKLPVGRVLCMLAKATKRDRANMPEEFNIEELNLCAGKDVYGWVESQEFSEPWMLRRKIDLLLLMDKFKFNERKAA